MLTHVWDNENRLRRYASSASSRTTSTYNGDGLRFEQHDSLGTRLQYVWDGQNILADYDTVFAWKKIYTLDPQGYGRLLSSNEGFYHFDALGSTERLTDGSGETIVQYLYEAYGRIANFSFDPANNPFTFVGELGYMLQDAKFALPYYVRARWYDPRLARWLSKDPIGFAGGDGNLYRYVRNSPVLFQDASGLATVTIKPSSVRRMPYIQCTNFEAFDPGFLGGTRPCSTSVTCSCDAGEFCRSLRCAARIQLETIITTLGRNVRLAYAHEQQHVLSWLQFAKDLKQFLEDWEQQLARHCTTYTAQYVAAAASDQIETFTKGEIAHTNPLSPASGDLTFTTIGPFPTSPAKTIACKTEGPCQ